VRAVDRLPRCIRCAGSDLSAVVGRGVGDIEVGGSLLHHLSIDWWEGEDCWVESPPLPLAGQMNFVAKLFIRPLFSINLSVGLLDRFAPYRYEAVSVSSWDSGQTSEPCSFARCG